LVLQKVGDFVRMHVLKEIVVAVALEWRQILPC